VLIPGAGLCTRLTLVLHTYVSESFVIVWVGGVQTDDEAMELNKVLTDKLLELDDVDAVYSNQK